MIPYNMFISWEVNFVFLGQFAKVLSVKTNQNQFQTPRHSGTSHAYITHIKYSQILVMALLAHFQGAEVLLKPVYPLSMAAPVLTIMATKWIVWQGTLSPQHGLYDHFTPKEKAQTKNGTVTTELWTPPCNSATHSSCHVLLSFSDSDQSHSDACQWVWRTGLPQICKSFLHQNLFLSNL